MSKKISIFLLSIVFCLLSAISFVVLANSSNYVKAVADPTVDIYACNLEFTQDTHIMYAVEVKNSESVPNLYVWSNGDGEYLTQDNDCTTLSYSYMEEIEGHNCYVFVYDKLNAKQMTDYFYAKATVEGNVESKLVKYSVLSYALRMRDKQSVSQSLKDLLVLMLDYGNGAQQYFGYNEDRPANGTYYLVKLDGGTFTDLTDSGYFQDGESFDIITPEEMRWFYEDGTPLGSTFSLTENCTLTLKDIEYEASVNGTKYEKLEDAISALKANDTIILLKDAENTGAISLPVGVTFDGDGHKLTGTSSIYANNGATIKNVIFSDLHNQSNKQGAVYAESLQNKITIKDCTFDNVDWDAIQISGVLTNADIDINGNTFKHTAEKTVTQQRYIHIQSDDTMDFTVKVNGNTFSDGEKIKQDCVEIYYPKEISKVDLSGNTVDENFRVELFTDKTYKNVTHEVILPFADGDFKPTVMIIHDVYTAYFYETIEDAQSALKANDTIILLKDAENTGAISLPVGVTFDGNGYKLTGASSVYVNNGGTVKNVIFSDLHNQSNKQGAVYAESLQNKITVKDCTFDNVDWDAIQISGVLTNADIDINGNTFKHTAEKSVTQQRYIHIQSDDTMDFTVKVNGNTFSDGDKIKQDCVEIYYPKEISKVDLSGNTVDENFRVELFTDKTYDNVTHKAIFPFADGDFKPTAIRVHDTYTAYFYETLEDAKDASEIGDKVYTTEVSLTKVSDGFWKSGTNEYLIEDIDGLKYFRDSVNGGNSFGSANVKLMTSIDLDSETWVSIGNGKDMPTNGFTGSFDGCNNTISNLVCNDDKLAGFFGAVAGNVKNLKVVNATITSHHHAGVIAGRSYSPITNCYVENASITITPALISDTEYDDGDKAGIIVGYAEGATVTGCTVKDCMITGYRDLGGIAGASHNNATNNTIDGLTIIQDDTNGYRFTKITTVGAIVGYVLDGCNDIETDNDVKNYTNVSVFDGYTVSDNKIYRKKIYPSAELVPLNENELASLSGKVLVDDGESVYFADSVAKATKDLDAGVSVTVYLISGDSYILQSTRSSGSINVTVIGLNDYENKMMTSVQMDNANNNETHSYTTTLFNLTVKNTVLVGEDADANGDSCHGAGFCYADSLLVENCIFTKSQCLWNSGKEYTIRNCTFKDPYRPSDTKAAYLMWTRGSNGTWTFEDCDFISAGKALKLYATTGTVNVTRCDFTIDTLNQQKKAIENDSSATLKVTDCTQTGYSDLQ